MFQIDPNTVYTITEVATMSNSCRGAVYNMIKNGLVSANGPRGQMITGKSLLAYFNGESQKPSITAVPNKTLDKKILNYK